MIYQKGITGVMKIEVKWDNWEIFTIFTLSLLFTIITIFFPDKMVVRILLGIPFIIYYPGYVATLALFPNRYKEEISKVEKKRVRKTRFSPGTQLIREIEKANIKRMREGINDPTRLALSVALSLGITPLLGALLLILYPLERDLFGLHTNSVLFSILGFIIIVGMIGLIKRSNTPPEERYQPKIVIGPFSDGGMRDRIITLTLVLLIMASLVSSYMIYTSNKKRENFTEMYLLGPDQSLSNYPKRLIVDEESTVFLGIVNRENSEQEYHLAIYLGDMGTDNVSVKDFTSIVLERNRTLTWDLTMDHGERFEQEITFNIPESGKYDLWFSLFRAEEKYREVNLTLQVFDPSDWVSHEDDVVDIYLTGPGGYPGQFPETVEAGAVIPIEVGIINKMRNPTNINISLSLSDTDTWIPYNLSRRWDLDNASGQYILFNMGVGEEVILKLYITFPRGSWTFRIGLENIDPRISIKKSITTY